MGNKMTDYSELVKALRICSSELNCGDCPLLYRGSCSSDELMNDAAAAIEALQAEVKFYKNFAEEWQETAYRKERLLGMYRAQNIYSAKDTSGNFITNLCSSNRSETPNS